MTSNFGLTGFQNRRQALINLALKRDPTPIRPKPNVSFGNHPQPAHTTVDELPPATDTSVNELPPMNNYISVISSPSHVTVPELSPSSPKIIPTSARSISTNSLML